jgi:hypothetical protein
LNKLNVETLDCIIIATNNKYFCNNPVKALVNKANYDSDSNSIEFECWLPVRPGEMEPYIFAWPADLSVDVLYPSVGEINGGFAGSPHSNVPTNLAYKIKPNVNLIDQLELRPKDYGDAFPSDGTNFLPATPLAGLNEADYLTMKPKNFKLQPVPKFGEKDRKPEFDSPIGGRAPTSSGRFPFVARVSKVIDKDRGQYEVKTVNGYTYAVNQFNSGPNLKEKDPVTVIYEESRNEYVVLNGSDSGNVALTAWIIREELNDYLKCVPFDYKLSVPTLHDENLGLDNEAFIKIAKPRLLQRTPFDSKTINYWNISVTYSYSIIGVRTASSPGKNNETQIITPPYFIGDIIVARKAPTGYENVDYIDINEGGRQWALVVS